MGQKCSDPAPGGLREVERGLPGFEVEFFLVAWEQSPESEPELGMCGGLRLW